MLSFWYFKLLLYKPCLCPFRMTHWAINLSSDQLPKRSNGSPWLSPREAMDLPALSPWEAMDLPVLSPGEAMNLLSGHIPVLSPWEAMHLLSSHLPVLSPWEAMHLLSSHLPVLSPGEAVTELWVCELVDPAGRCYTEVPPHVLTRPEVQLLHRPGTRLETLTNAEQDPKLVAYSVWAVLSSEHSQTNGAFMSAIKVRPLRLRVLRIRNNWFLRSSPHPGSHWWSWPLSRDP